MSKSSKGIYKIPCQKGYYLFKLENNDVDVSIFLPTEQKVRNNSFGFITSQEEGKPLKITIKIQINGEFTQYEIEK